MNEALGTLSRVVADPDVCLEEAFRSTVEIVADTLEVERVGIWRFEDDRQILRCVALFQRSERHHSKGQVLEAERYPAYFRALEASRFIAADDAVHHPSTREFGVSYLEPNGITAMLDAPVLFDNAFDGVICHEHVGEGPRAWTLEEKTFCGAAADLVALARQTRSRLTAERKLRRREQELQLAMYAANLGTWTWTIVTDEIVWSEHAGPMYGKPAGWSPSGTREYLELLHPDDRLRVAQEFEHALSIPEGRYRSAYRVVHPDGTVRCLEGVGQVIPGPDGDQMAGTITDVTERRKVEAHLQHNQKMEQLGHLAGEVAHDFNNLLAVILACSDMLSLEVGDNENVETILHAAERASTLTARLLTFARQDEYRPTRLDLNDFVRAATPVLRRLLRGPVDLQTACWPEPLPVEADAAQLEHVLLNLVVNARDAMPDGGSVEVQTTCVGDGAETHARLLVRDTGTGIPPEVIDRVFEPFFTTKKVGGGTGLGLATCYSVVTRMGGTLSLVSEVGVGTTVMVDLPRRD